MKNLPIILSFFILFYLPGLTNAQENNPSANDLLKKLNPNETPTPEKLLKLGITPEKIKSMNPSDIPSPDKLRQMGISEEEINMIESIRVQKSTSEQGTSVAPSQEIENQTQKSESVTTSSPEVTYQKEGSEIFGQDFFENRQIGYFQKTSDVKTPDNYLLSPGDKINVSVWGFSDYNDVFLISEDGSIQPKETGKIFLKGLRFSDARSLLKNRFESFLDLKNSKFDITLIQARVITINIVGEVKNPGSYYIPAVNTAFNALVAAGGLSPIGSVRKIQVRREGKTIRSLDIYEFLMNPDSKQDFYLEDNDYIIVPPYGKIVSITGKVKRPGNFELLDKENLKTLISYAGAFTADAFIDKFNLKRLEKNKEILLDILYGKLHTSGKDFELKDGDDITVSAIPSGTENYVEINGAVKLPGKYQFINGTRIYDIIQRAEGVNKEFYPDKGYLLRLQNDYSRQLLPIFPGAILKNPSSSENILLQEEDIVSIFSKKDFMDQYTVALDGEVRKPDIYPYADGMTLKDLILRSGGFLETSYLSRGFVLRYRDDMSSEYIPVKFDTGSTMKSLDTFLLKKGDRIRVFSKNFFLDNDSVEISGTVRTPGTFYYSPGMTLYDAIYMAGGLKREAANNIIEVSRITFYDKLNKKKGETVIVKRTKAGENLEIDSLSKAFELFPYDHIFIRKDPDFEYPENVFLSGEVNYPGTYTLKSKKDKITDIIERAGGLTNWAFPEGATMLRSYQNAGNVILDMKRAIKKPKSAFNYVLKDGDEIIIPRINELIKINGAVKYPGVDSLTSVNSPFYKGKRAKFYVNHFTAGFDKNAWKRKTYVIYPNKLIHQTTHFGLFKIYPKVVLGSTIVVPEKPEKKQKDKSKDTPVKWHEFFQGFSASLVSILTLTVLMKNFGNL